MSCIAKLVLKKQVSICYSKTTFWSHHYQQHKDKILPQYQGPNSSSKLSIIPTDSISVVFKRSNISAPNLSFPLNSSYMIYSLSVGI